jgi:hypothetical protein
MCQSLEIESIYLNTPNIHFLLVNMPIVGVKVKFNFYHGDLSYINLHLLMTTKGFLFGVLHHKSKQCLFTIFSCGGKVSKYGYQPFRLNYVFICFFVQFGDNVFIPIDEPHGSIEAQLNRKPILISNL